MLLLLVRDVIKKKIHFYNAKKSLFIFGTCHLAVVSCMMPFVLLKTFFSFKAFSFNPSNSCEFKNYHWFGIFQHWMLKHVSRRFDVPKPIFTWNASLKCHVVRLSSFKLMAKLMLVIEYDVWLSVDRHSSIVWLHLKVSLASENHFLGSLITAKS